QRGLKMAFAGGALLVLIVLAFLFGRAQRRVTRAPTLPAALNWRGERLDGPAVALTPRISPDGKELAFAAMVESQSQLAVMMVDSGDWKVLTTNRDRGLLSQLSWSPDGSQIFYDRVAGMPMGVYRISKYGGEERLVLEGAMHPKVRPDGSIV